MKKFFFSICALAALAIGCTKSEVVNAPDMGAEISFSSYVGRAPISKATVATVADVANGFTVVAYKHADDMPTETELAAEPYMYNTSVTGTIGAEDKYSWSYTPVQYWPSDGSNLAFFAYANNAGTAFAANDGSKTGFTYTVPTSVAEQKDLLVAQSVAKRTYEEGAVPVKFYHLLSRVGFKLSIVGSESVTVNSLTLNGPFSTTGTVDLAETVETTTGEGDEAVTTTSFAVPNIVAGTTLISTPYELLADNASFSLTTGESAIYDNNEAEGHTATLTETNRYMMLIPCASEANAEGTDNDFKIVVSYSVGDDNLTATATLDDTWAFEAGKAYEFVLKISSAAIEFEVSVEAWDETDDDGNTYGDTFTLNGTVVSAGN